MNKHLKRFLYFWRFPIFFFILFFVLIFLAGIDIDSTASTVFSVIWLCVDVPCLIFFTIRAIYRHIRSFINYCRTGERETEYSFPEIEFFSNMCYKISLEVSSVSELSGSMKVRYFLFRFIGIVLIIGGSIACFFFSGSYVLMFIFALVIIGGATLCIMANPKSYNSSVSGVRMVSCSKKITEQDLFQALSTIDTPLGFPQFADVNHFDDPIMVYGPDLEENIYAVYRPKHAAYLYVSTLSSYSLFEQIESPLASKSEEENPTYIYDSRYYLDEIAAAVEEAVSCLEEK